MNQKDTTLLRKLDVCSPAREWCKTMPDFETAWNTCKRSDWMLWALDQIGYKDDKALRLYACACVRGTPLADGRTVWDLLTDKKSRGAVEVSERYAIGQATDKELDAAREAWYAAGAASKVSKVASAVAKINRAAARAAARAVAEAVAEVVEAAAEVVEAADAAWYAARATGDVSKAARANGAAMEWQADKLREFVTWEQVSMLIEGMK